MNSPFLYPLFIFLFPILHTYKLNQNLLIPEVLIAPIIFVIIMASLAYLGLYLILRNKEKAAFATFVFGGFFYFLYPIILWMNSNPIIPLSLKKGRYKLAVFLVLFVTILYFIKKSKKRFNEIPKALNFITLFLVIINIPFGSTQERKVKPTQQIDQPINTSGKVKPDIYYIIFDGYTNAEVLKKLYGFENKELINKLRKKGFFISNSFANYNSTNLSMASTFGMEYLGGSKESYLKIKTKNEVDSFLKKHNYKFYSQLESADFERQKSLKNLFSLNEFSIMIMRSTLFDSFAIRLNLYDLQYRNNLSQSFNNLKKSIHRNGPKFVYAHFMCPHPPYVFMGNGEPYKMKYRSSFNPMVGMWDDRQGYLEQIKYSNKLILEFLDELFKNKDPDSFIVIIQGDHGAKFSRNNDEGDDVFYKRQLGILNAYYLPNKESRKKLYEKISPINSFRLIFNEFLEGNFPLHEDKHFYSDFLEQFDYKEVGSILYKNGNNN